MGREYEVYPVTGGTVVRVLAEDELEAAETAQGLVEGEAYVYPAEIPVGAQGVDPEAPNDEDYQ